MLIFVKIYTEMSSCLEDLQCSPVLQRLSFERGLLLLVAVVHLYILDRVSDLTRYKS